MYSDARLVRIEADDLDIAYEEIRDYLREQRAYTIDKARQPGKQIFSTRTYHLDGVSIALRAWHPRLREELSELEIRLVATTEHRKSRRINRIIRELKERVAPLEEESTTPTDGTHLGDIENLWG